MTSFGWIFRQGIHHMWGRNTNLIFIYIDEESSSGSYQKGGYLCCSCLEWMPEENSHGLQILYQCPSSQVQIWAPRLFEAKRACSKTWGNTRMLLWDKSIYQREEQFRRENPAVNKDLRMTYLQVLSHREAEIDSEASYPNDLHPFQSSFQYKKFFYLFTFISLLILPNTPCFHWETACHRHLAIKESLRKSLFLEHGQMRIIIIKALFRGKNVLLHWSFSWWREMKVSE